MSQRAIFLAVGVLALIAVVVVLTDRTGKKNMNQDPRLGVELLTTEDVRTIDRITVTSAGKSIVMQATEGGAWGFAEDQFPVNADRIATIVDSFIKVKHSRLVTSDPNSLAELGLGEEVGTAVLFAAGDSEVLNVQLGERRQKGGQYIRHGSETKAYLIDQAVAAVSDVGSWELKQLIDLDKDQVATVDYLPGEGSDRKQFTLHRDTAEAQLRAKDLQATEEMSSNANQALSVFTGLNFKDRHDPSLESAKTALLKPDKVVVTMLDGRRYEGWVGTIGEAESAKHFLRLAAQLDQGEWDEKERATGERLNSLMDRWAFEIPAHVATKLRRNRADLVKAKAS